MFSKKGEFKFKKQSTTLENSKFSYLQLLSHIFTFLLLLGYTFSVLKILDSDNFKYSNAVIHAIESWGITTGIDFIFT